MSNINRPLFPEYNINAIETMMSLRKPQKTSLVILETILSEIDLDKNIDIESSQNYIHGIFSIFKEFERPFMSLTFELATGVGKTKLMGAFMTYLYTQKGIRNFFVVAPSLTIYEKLKNDLGNPNPDNAKYVFKGVSCFATKKPNIWTDDDYKTKPAKGLFDSDSINIYIFNISKFNSEDREMKNINEYLGESFYDYLSSLEDLVVIMDESHHYRAEASSSAINNLKPVLGIELTATAKTQDGNTDVYFRNVVFEYPLSSAIKDGYTRTPHALTRRDLHNYDPSPEELDKIMLDDGIKHHEIVKQELKRYAINNSTPENPIRIVKPFMLVVCKDTTHAKKVFDYINSDSFRNGDYKNTELKKKVIIVHSNQTGDEKAENVAQLLEVEKSDNPVEIVVHVNKLKEGWDVNNLYTIVPLRTATSKVLREQTIGRGLRLPYGQRTGDSYVDSVTITAHDKFDELVREAASSDSVFHKAGMIYTEDEKERQMRSSSISLLEDEDNNLTQEIADASGVEQSSGDIEQVVNDVVSAIQRNTAEQLRKQPYQRKVNLENLRASVELDLGARYANNTDVQKIIDAAFNVAGDEIIEQVTTRMMYIPKLRTEDFGEEEYIIKDFDLDMSEMNYLPIKNDILIKNLVDTNSDAVVIRGDVIEFDTFKPELKLIEGIQNIGEIDYDKCSTIIQKIVSQFLSAFRARFKEEEVRNIILMNYRDILSKMKEQLLKNLAVKYNGLVEVVSEISTLIYERAYDFSNGYKNLYEAPETGINIKTLLYGNASKSVTNYFKFDSNPERKFACCCQDSPEVKQWLRPDPRQFNITYNRGKAYEPDFVVETDDCYYLVEVKDRSEMNDPDVVAKKERAISYCKVASAYNKANGHKEFKYLFIPHDDIEPSRSFNYLKDRYLSE